jgi:Na+/H+ antiporter NhaD/arsenite permease-like protein
VGLPVHLVAVDELGYFSATVGTAAQQKEFNASHRDVTAAAAGSVLVSNLPAGSLLAAGTPGHPFPLLTGLNLGPNRFATGSLAWLLWLRAARATGAQPSVARASRIGALASPLSMAAALAIVALTGSS